jgi:hypothetical protein
LADEALGLEPVLLIGAGRAPAALKELIGDPGDLLPAWLP